MAKLKVTGAWAGVLEVELEEWTMPILRGEVARRSNVCPESINLICAGKILKDGDATQKLSQLGIKNNTKIFAIRASAGKGKFLKVELIPEEERSSRLARLKAAATALSQRHSDGLSPAEDLSLEIQNHGGERVDLGSETDQKAIMLGLIFHANAKKLIKQEIYKDALEVLSMGEEAFSLCNSKILELADNVPILQIDMVWCYFLLQDISWLLLAGVRLEKAREGIERCHGKDLLHIRLLQADRQPELSLLLRLELLEGIVAYHNGQFDKSLKALTSARTKFFQHTPKRIVIPNNLDIGIAIDFLLQEKAKGGQKREYNIQHRREILEQKLHGLTPLKKAVVIERLKEIASIRQRFKRVLAAAARQRNHKYFRKLDIQSRKKSTQQQTANATIEELVSLGFERSRVVAAVQACGTRVQIAKRLLPLSEQMPTIPSDSHANPCVLEPGGPSTSGEVRASDALSDCETEFPREALAIAEYLTLLESGNFKFNLEDASSM